MKKFFAAVLAMTVGASAFAVTETLVYDYKASFKRIDAQYKVKSVEKVKYVTDTYAVKSDSLKGYVVIPACIECDAENGMTNFNNEVVDYGTAYLTRTGDKYAKKAGLDFVVKTKADVQAAIFGAFVKLTTPAETAPLKSIKDAKKAWMSLDFTLPEGPQALDSTLVLKNVAAMDGGLTYGFYGLDNVSAGEVQNAGFGTAKIMSWKEAAELGWCDTTPGTEGSCQMITSISGSMIGDPTYAGACDTTPMWDVCFNNGDEHTNTVTVSDAVVAGTWTLKYNKKLSTAADKEAAILKALKATAADVIDLTRP